MIQIEKYFSNGHHDIAATITGCDKAIRLEENASGHCDHLLFERLTTRDCLTTFYSDCEQAVNHKFNFVEHYCPVGVQSDVFNYQKGGNMKADMVTLTGGYGCTLLRTRQAASNGGSYIIDGLSVDRALLTATQASHGYFRLVDHESGSGFTIRIRGHMDFSSANIAVENWQNGGGEATVALRRAECPLALGSRWTCRDSIRRQRQLIRADDCEDRRGLGNAISSTPLGHSRIAGR